MSLRKKLFNRLGLGFAETMHGVYTEHKTGRQSRYTFNVQCKNESLHDFMYGSESEQERTVYLEGLLAQTIDGASRTTTISGKLVIFDDMKLKYSFDYKDPYTKENMRFYGEKQVTVTHPVKSMTTLRGTVERITPGGVEEVGTVESKFKLSELVSFLRTWKIRR